MQNLNWIELLLAVYDASVLCLNSVLYNLCFFNFRMRTSLSERFIWPGVYIEKGKLKLHTVRGLYRERQIKTYFFQGSISISLSLHQTSFCFVCSHLTSGQKEGDELRRNSDVMEILRKTRFPPIHGLCEEKSPESILEHE